MAKPLLDDALWSKIEPLLPPHPPHLKGGRLQLPDRAALTDILFVLRTGIPWEYLSKEMGCGSGMTCWRRLRDWQTTGNSCIRSCWSTCSSVPKSTGSA